MQSPQQAFEFIIKDMPNQPCHGFYYADIGCGWMNERIMFGLSDTDYRQSLGAMLKKHGKYNFYFAPPCSLDGWVLIVSHKDDTGPTWNEIIRRTQELKTKEKEENEKTSSPSHRLELFSFEYLRTMSVQVLRSIYRKILP